MSKNHFYELLSVSQLQEDVYNVAFKDGGVLQLNGKVAPIIPTPQVMNFQERYSVQGDKESITEELQAYMKKITISSVKSNDISKYSWNKEYIMSDNSNIKVNSIGVLYNDIGFYDFEEFLAKFKDTLHDEAIFEFNKYLTKQNTGERIINPFNLAAKDVALEEIATALSGINRFAGQTKALHDTLDNDFYTVGQHTLAMYYTILETPEKLGLIGYEKEELVHMAKQALLHEAYEGITGTDLISPFKYATSKNEYKIAENEAEAVLEKVFDFPLMTPELKSVDKMMASTEGYYLVGQSHTDWSAYAQVLEPEVLQVYLSQTQVKERLIELYYEHGFFNALESYIEAFDSHLEEDVIYRAKLEEYSQVFEGYSLDDASLKTLTKLRSFGGLQKEDEEIRFTLETGKELKITTEGEVFISSTSGDIRIHDLSDTSEISQKMHLNYEERLSQYESEEQTNSNIQKSR